MAPARSAGSVLIVDDDSELREGLCDVLSEEGYSVIGATDGADALEQLSEFALPDVVLLDLGMPRMDGYEFLERRDADELLRGIPVIVISSSADRTRLGYRTCTTLTKPVDLVKLLGVLQREIVERRPGNDVG